MPLFCRRGNLVLVFAVLHLLVPAKTMMVPRRLMAPLSSIKGSRGTKLQTIVLSRVDGLVASYTKHSSYHKPLPARHFSTASDSSASSENSKGEPSYTLMRW